MHELTPKDISKLIKQAGFKSKASFARHFGFNVNTISHWANTRDVPDFFLPLIEKCIKAKKYDELIKAKNCNE